MSKEEKIAELETVLSEASTIIKNLETQLKTLLAPPFELGAVVEANDQGVLISAGDEPAFVNTPDPNRLVVAVGDAVFINPMSKQIIAIAPIEHSGPICEVKVVAEDPRFIEADAGGEIIWCRAGKFLGQINIGDKIILDPAGLVVLQVIPQNKSSYQFNEHSDVSWDDIGGLEQAKQLLREAIEYPVRFKDLYKHYNKRPSKGAILCGPPGCGKTMLAKAVATALADLYQSRDSGYLYIKGPELLDKYVGATEARIREIFKVARQIGKDKKTRVVVFIDEADAILQKRGTGISSDVNNTIVPSFLAEMDGLHLEEFAPFILLASNLQKSIDPAVLRDGRIDHRIFINRPSTSDAGKQILDLHLKNVPIASEDLTQQAAEFIFSEQHPIYNVRLRGDASSIIFHLKHFISGAMLGGIADKAISCAIRRDMKSGKFDKVSDEDMVNAITETLEEVRLVSHEDALKEFAEASNKQIESVEPWVNR